MEKSFISRQEEGFGDCPVVIGLGGGGGWFGGGGYSHYFLITMCIHGVCPILNHNGLNPVFIFQSLARRSSTPPFTPPTRLVDGNAGSQGCLFPRADPSVPLAISLVCSQKPGPGALIDWTATSISAARRKGFSQQ